ncbi:MAG: hypothetical protein ACRC92_25290 [Peptostreptococcaceae bacterium]
MARLVTILFHIGAISLMTYAYLYFTDNVEVLNHPIFMLIGTTFSSVVLILGGLYIYFENNNVNTE